MSKHHYSDDPNEPIQDFIDWEEHRYDPGYWPQQWYSRGRMDPYYKAMQNAHLSSFYRALLVTPVVGVIPEFIFLRADTGLAHPAFWCAGTLLFLFFALWFLIHRSMVRRYGREAAEAMEHGRSPAHHHHEPQPEHVHKQRHHKHRKHD